MEPLRRPVSASDPSDALEALSAVIHVLESARRHARRRGIDANWIVRLMPDVVPAIAHLGSALIPERATRVTQRRRR